MKVYFEKEVERRKEEWKQYRWLGTLITNMSGKHIKGRDVKEEDLFRFSDEIVMIDPEERRRQALETATYLAKIYPKLIKKGKDGKPLIYGEN